jgi:hypothetical protein
MVDCTKDLKFWKCFCENPRTLEIDINGINKEPFDFIIWYDVSKPPEDATDIERDNYRRKREVNDKVFVEQKEPVNLPVSNIMIVVLLIGTVFVTGIVVLGYWAYKKFKDDEDEDSVSDRDVDEYLRKMSK